MGPGQGKRQKTNEIIAQWKKTRSFDQPWFNELEIFEEKRSDAIVEQWMTWTELKNKEGELLAKLQISQGKITTRANTKIDLEKVPADFPEEEKWEYLPKIEKKEYARVSTKRRSLTTGESYLDNKDAIAMCAQMEDIWEDGSSDITTGKQKKKKTDNKEKEETEDTHTHTPHTHTYVLRYCFPSTPSFVMHISNNTSLFGHMCLSTCKSKYGCTP